MKIEYFARNATIDDQVRRYAEEKLRKLAKFLDDPEEAEARLTLEHEKHHFVAEVQLSHRHGTLVAKETANQLLDAVNLAVDKVETQAERSRKKHKEKRRRAQRHETNGHHWPEEVIARDSVAAGADGGRRVVETTQARDQADEHRGGGARARGRPPLLRRLPRHGYRSRQRALQAARRELRVDRARALMR